MKNDVRVLRQERGWTQQELGKQLGISRQAIIAIENERFDPSLQLAMKIALLFERQIEEIFRLGD